MRIGAPMVKVARVLWIAVLCAGVQAGEPVAAPQAPLVLPQVEIQKDIVYGTGGGVELKLDFVKPLIPSDKPVPVIVCIHGGAWTSGNKRDVHEALRLMAAHGFAAASISYRFCPEHRFPAQIEDCKCAVRFLRSKAKEWNLDPQRIGAMGFSAGGHLSLMLGLMDKADGLEGDGGHAHCDSKVQAVVNFFGPTDFTQQGAWTPLHFMMVANFTGSMDQADKVMKAASPVTYIDPKDPPVLTFHGTADPVVPYPQAEQLDTLLKKSGVRHEFVTLEKAGHGWKGEKLQETALKAVEFFKKELGVSPK